MNYLLIDLGGTKCRTTLRNQKNEPVIIPHHVNVKVTDDVLKSIIDSIKPYNNYINKKTVIKIAVPGLVKKNKILQLPNLNIGEWDLAKELKRLYYNKVLVYNDLEAAWHGEYTDKNFLLVYASTGVGGAINGENIEFGRRITINTNGEIKYHEIEKTLTKNDLEKNEFILEHLTGGLALGKAAVIKGLQLGVNINKYGEELDQYAHNNEIARSVFEDAGSILGKAIQAYAETHKVKNVIIGGSLGTNTYYFNAIKKQVKNINIQKSKFLNSSEAIFRGLLKL